MTADFINNLLKNIWQSPITLLISESTKWSAATKYLKTISLYLYVLEMGQILILSIPIPIPNSLRAYCKELKMYYKDPIEKLSTILTCFSSLLFCFVVKPKIYNT